MVDLNLDRINFHSPYVVAVSEVLYIMIEKKIMPTINVLNSKTSASNIYWDMLKDLSSDIKLELIAKLSASLLAKEDTPDTSNWTSEFAGRWEDDRTTDEIIEDIRGARTSNREIEL